MPGDKDISTIILAGGKSKRLGQDKKSLKITGNNLFLWQHIAQIAAPLSSEILIIANPLEINTHEYNVIPDIIPGLGPLGGIYTGLKLIKNSCAFVLPVDMPLLTTGILKRLEQKLSDNKIIIARHNGLIEPLVAIYPKKILPLVEQMIERKEYKLRLLFDRFPCEFVDFDDNTPFLNINTPEDLKKIQQRIKIS